jgi:hypothetical protein
MRPEGRLKLGFYPLAEVEAERLRAHLRFPEEFSALDPSVGEGIAFDRLLQGTRAHKYGIEIDGFRAQKAATLGIEVVKADAFQVRCPAESVSLLYLNPPYDFEAGENGNQRQEKSFLQHTFRWLKPRGVLVFVLPRKQVGSCARLLAEQFLELRMYRLTAPESIRFDQVAIMGWRRPRLVFKSDDAVRESERMLREHSASDGLSHLSNVAEATYAVPASPRTRLRSQAIPLDEVEDVLPSSSAYRQAARVLIHEPVSFRGRPLTPLHGGHVSLLATAGMLNGVFGLGADRHIAHWRSVKFVDSFEETLPDGTLIEHERERFSHELTLVFADGRSRTLTHAKKSGEP